jgi:hypothetical protein
VRARAPAVEQQKLTDGDKCALQRIVRFVVCALFLNIFSQPPQTIFKDSLCAKLAKELKRVTVQYTVYDDFFFSFSSSPPRETSDERNNLPFRKGPSQNQFKLRSSTADRRVAGSHSPLVISLVS